MMFFTLFAIASALDNVGAKGQLRGPHPGVPAAKEEIKEHQQAEVQALKDQVEDASATPIPAGGSSADPAGAVTGAAGDAAGAATDAAGDAAGAAMDTAGDMAGAGKDIASGKLASEAQAKSREELANAWAAAKKGDVKTFLLVVYKQMAMAMTIGGVGYLLVGALVWYFACKGSERAPRRATKEELKRGDFEPVGLCACCNWKVLNIFEALCCPHFLWAETAGKLQVLNFFVLLVLVILALALIPVTFSVTMYLFIMSRIYIRYSMRQRFEGARGGQGCCFDMVWDCCIHLLCFPCAASQEAEFVEHLEHHGTIKV